MIAVYIAVLALAAFAQEGGQPTPAPVAEPEHAFVITSKESFDATIAAAASTGVFVKFYAPWYTATLLFAFRSLLFCCSILTKFSQKSFCFRCGHW